jgi:hypothetical protein
VIAVIHACVSYCAIPNLSTVQYRALNPIEPLCNGDNVIIAIQQPCFIFSQIRYRRIDEIVWIQRSTAAEMSVYLIRPLYISGQHMQSRPNNQWSRVGALDCAIYRSPKHVLSEVAGVAVKKTDRAT